MPVLRRPVEPADQTESEMPNVALANRRLCEENLREALFCTTIGSDARVARSPIWNLMMRAVGARLTLRVNQEAGDRQVRCCRRLPFGPRRSRRSPARARMFAPCVTTRRSHSRSDTSAVTLAPSFGAPERNTPPRASMRDHDVDQCCRDQQQLGLERRIAYDMRRIGAEQQESHADREQKTETRQRQ
jgi:hypothetical protein